MLLAPGVNQTLAISSATPVPEANDVSTPVRLRDRMCVLHR